MRSIKYCKQNGDGLEEWTSRNYWIQRFINRMVENSVYYVG